MKRKRHCTRAEAQEEMNIAFDRYFERSPEIARAFLDEIGASLKRIVARPQLFPIYLDETRRRICDRFSYSIIYREKEDVILILAVAHAKQRPGYWKKRR